MPITPSSSVTAIRQQAEHLASLMMEPADLEQRNDTVYAIRELRNVIHMKFTYIGERIVDLKKSIEAARDGSSAPWLLPEDIPELERELRQYQQQNRDLVQVAADYL